MITGGDWKGYKGLVVGTDDKSMMIEITSKYRRIPIDRNFIDLNFKGGDKKTGAESTHGGNTVYEIGKTPMYQNTPSCYPQSPHWGV